MVLGLTPPAAPGCLQTGLAQHHQRNPLALPEVYMQLRSARHIPACHQKAASVPQGHKHRLPAAGSMAGTAAVTQTAAVPEAAITSEPGIALRATSPPRSGPANTRHHQRRLARKVDEISQLVQSIASPVDSASGTRSSAWLDAGAASSSGIDWDAVPAACNPAEVLGAGTGTAKQHARARRKRSQVESFVVVLQRMLAQWPQQQLMQQSQHLHALHSQLSEAVPLQAQPQQLQQPQQLPQQQGQCQHQQHQHQHCTQSSQPCHLVDFGSGTGNLVLALAHFFPHCRFTAVDMKPEALRLLQQRVQQAGLSNVSVWQGQVEYYDEPFDVALALHACGNATDYALAKAVEVGAAYVVSPCCVGKLKFSLMGGSSFHPHLSTWTPQLPGDRPDARKRVITPKMMASGSNSSTNTQAVLLADDAASKTTRSNGVTSDAIADGRAAAVQAPQQPLQLQHPRSAWLTRSLSPEPQRLFANLARVADFAHSCDVVVPGEAKEERAGAAELCKRIVEWDRNEAAREAGYAVGLVKMLGADEMTKNDLLMGVPTDFAAVAGSAQLWRHCWHLLAMPSMQQAPAGHCNTST